MTIRNRRLQRDHEKVLAELCGSEFVSVRVVAGDPPNHYQVTYRVSGLMWNDSDASTIPISQHIVDIYLPLGYPKQAPRCTMKTPIWHPNIGDYVCIGDYWSAGVTLVNIIAHIGDMVQYKNYNLKSPVNKAAALWAQRNLKSFPIGTREILPSEDAQPFIALDATRMDEGIDISLGAVRERK